MRRFLLFFACAMFSVQLYGQTLEASGPQNYDVMPQIKSDKYAGFLEYVAAEAKFPEALLGMKQPQGRAIVKFVVNQKGKVGNIEVVFADHKEMAKEALRVIAQSPEWIPATLNGKPVSGGLTLVIPFSMDKDGFVNPSFQGKPFEEFANYVRSNVRYPSVCFNKKIQGKVIVNFVVDTEGNLKDFKVVQSPHQELAYEVFRVLKSTSKWQWYPGFAKGKPVPVRLSLPVTFKLTKSTESN